MMDSYACRCSTSTAGVIHLSDCPFYKQPVRVLVTQPVTAEELGKVLFDATANLDSEFGRWAATFDELEDIGREMWTKSAAAILEKYSVRRK